MNDRNKTMMRIARFVVDKRWIFLVLFLAAIVFSVFSAGWVQVEEDITAYLPDDAEARRGLTIMEEEFLTYGTAQIMLKDVTPEEAQACADQISGVEDVLLVMFDTTEQHYRDGKALFDVTFADVTESERSEKALESIRALLAGRDVTIYSEVGFSLSDLVAEQMLTVLIFVLIVVLAVLVFTSSTYAEIPVMIFTFMTAAMINIGTHFLMGTISFVSNSVAIVLQLALSVDYAIIFCNRYKEEHETQSIHDAVVKALAASIPEIFASSLTTIAGLTAMTFMKFRLGVDMGLCLIKAILCSLLTVFFFMPCLLMAFGKAMDKSKHKRFVPKISFVGKFAYATRHVFPILFVALVIGAYIVFGRINYAYCVDIVPALRQTEMEAAQAEIRKEFGESNLVAVLVPAGDYRAEKALLEDLEACDEVKTATGLTTIEIMDGLSLGDSVTYDRFAELAQVDETTARALYAYYAAEKGDHRVVEENLEQYPASLIDLFLFLHDRLEAGEVELEEAQAAQIRELFTQLSMVRNQLMSDAHSRLVLDLNLPAQSDETFAFLDRIHVLAARYYDEEAVLTGNSVSALGFKDSFASDNMVVGLMSLVLVMLILFFTFRSFGMPLLLILIIQGSIWMNFAIAALRHQPVFFLCYLIVSAIQMGANIDYAIVVSSRYTELRQTMDRREAIITTLNLAFPTIITSGLMMVCAGLLIGFQVSQCVIAGMGYYVGTGTSISLCLILFALPQLLLLGDGFVTLTTLKPNGFLMRNRHRFAAALLAVAAVLALLAVPYGRRDGERYGSTAVSRADELLGQTAELRGIAEKLEQNAADYDALKYDFAEQLVTDELGWDVLAEGEEQYQAGLNEYGAGKAMYDAGAAQLADAKAQYNAGAAKLAEGQAAYDAGLAEYNAGKAAYDAGQQQLAEGQAAYDTGMAQLEAGKAEYAAGQQKLAEGQAAYDAGLAQYNAAKAQLDAVAPLMDNAVALQGQMNDLQAQYDDAVARGDLITAAALAGPLTAAQAAFAATGMDNLVAQYQGAQAELAAAEQQLAAGKAELDAGYAQAAEAEQQIAAAEAQLAEGKAKLDAGYAQAAEAEQQLAAGKAKLDAGKAELDAGYAELNKGGAQIAEGENQLGAAYGALKAGEGKLAEAADQIKEGREALEENRENLAGSLTALDQYTDEEERLNQGVALLSAEPGVKALTSRTSSPLEIVDAAERYFTAFREDAEKQQEASRRIGWILFAAAVLALLALLMRVFKWNRLPAILALLASAAAVLSLAMWRSRCPLLTPAVWMTAAVLAALAALYAAFLLSRHRAMLAMAAPAPEVTAPAPEEPAPVGRHECRAEAPAEAAPAAAPVAAAEAAKGDAAMLAAILSAFVQSEEFKTAVAQSQQPKQDK